MKPTFHERRPMVDTLARFRTQIVKAKKRQVPEHTARIEKVTDAVADVSDALDDAAQTLKNASAGMGDAFTELSDSIEEKLQGIKAAYEAKISEVREHLTKAEKAQERAGHVAEHLAEHEPVDMKECCEVQAFLVHLADPLRLNPWAHMDERARIERVQDFVAAVRAAFRVKEV